MTALADRLANLSPSKRELLARLLAATKSEQPTAPLTRREPGASPAPLSFTQERLWFLDQLLPGNAMYNMAGIARVSGPLDETAILATFNEIVRRHEVLRSLFQAEDGRPTLVIQDNLHLAPGLIDLSQRETPAQRESELQQLIVEDVQRPFDLAQGPLLRFTLFHLAEDEHVGLLVMHHIVADGISTQVLFREFAALYPALLKGEPCPLPELPVQYADFAAWQRAQMQGQVLEKQLAYWQEQFKEGVPALDLPTDHPRPAVPTHGGARQPIMVPAPLTQQLKALSRQEGVTLFMTLLAAFKALLYRYTGAPEIVVGVPVAGRNQPELAGMIGCFLNMLALRTEIEDTMPFRHLLARVKAVALGGYANQDLPFEKLVEALQPQRSLSQAPLAQVAFSFEEDPAGALQVEDLVFHFEEVPTGASKLDLGLELTEVKTAGGETTLQGWFEYSTDLFLAETMERMVGHFLTLLAGAVSEPQRPLAFLPLMTAAEQNQLLVTWNNTDAPYPMDRCLHDLFEAQVRETPDAVAVLCGESSLTYSELNKQANQVAHYLQRHGIGPESLVGICLERSTAMIVAVFGILKAGGAYVPLDASHPESRLEFMLADAQGTVVLTQQRFVGQLPQDQATLICLDRDWPTIARESGRNPESGVTADNLAYVLYTSGSTGQPKGVTVPHRDIVHHTLAFIEVQALTPADRMLMFVSLLFDAAAAALYPPLLCGAAVVLPEVASSELSGQETMRLCQAYDVTVVHQPASYWHQWVDDLAATGETFDTKLRLMMTGGEVPSIEKLRTWTRLLGRPTTFFNAYGPTESVITITLHKVTCRPELVDSLTRMPAGRPIPNKRIYLLDPYQQPTPIGVPGEVFVGGIGLARNYLNRPVQTAEKFLPDPFTPQPGARMYRTGDLARYLPDGNIEFLTRADDQLKIRGFRIEPGDVESALRRHPNVRESLVVGWKDPAGRLRLVAYLVAQTEPVPAQAALREYLKEFLPDYMLPSLFIFLERIPLTDLGKADRHALPAPTWERVEEVPFVAPATPAEQTLVNIWKEVLGVERVSRHDNFFDLGGDSILSMQIVARANHAGVRIIPRQVFQHQTIAELAAVADTTAEIVAEQGTVTGPVPLTPIQHWFFEQRLPEPAHWNQAIWLESRRGLEPARLKKAAAALQEHHDALRLRFSRQEMGGWQQINSADVVEDVFSHLDLAGLPPAAQAQRLDAEVARLQQSLDLTQGPLLRVALFNFGRQQPVRLLLLAHHLVVDGVSWRVLVEDLHAAYEAAETEGVAVLPPKSSSFQQWATRLEAYATANRTELERRFRRWLEGTAGRQGQIPLDLTGGANREETAETITVALATDTTRALLHEIPAAYHMNASELLLAALAPVLSDWTESGTVSIQLEGHGRADLFEEIDLSRTVGWFTTSYPVLLAPPVGNLDTLLKTTKEQLRQTPEDYVYGLLRYLTDSDCWRALPTPQVSFNYLGQLDQGIEAGHFTLLPEPPALARSRLGLRPFLLEINAFTVVGELHLAWTYSRACHQRTTIEKVVQNYLQKLKELVAMAGAVEGSQYTPSDFPDVALDQQDLDAVLAEIGLA